MRTKDMQVLLQFGAGNIGRSLCANIFSQMGWEIVFVDTDQVIVDEINARGEYDISVKEDTGSVLTISPVRAMSFTQHDEVLSMLRQADIISTAVGARNLSQLFPVFTEGLAERDEMVNVLICENVKNSEEMFHNGLAEAGFSHFDRISLIGTAIEKMVPNVPQEVRVKNPLATWGENYNILQVNGTNLCRPLPDSPDIIKVTSLPDCYERKLYIANFCNTLTSVIGFLNGFTFIAEALAVPVIKDFIKKAAIESSEALKAKHPDIFKDQTADAYISQFLTRLGNLSLKDTVYRGGRDIGRKLKMGERLVGPAVLYFDMFNKVPAALCRAVAAALYFQAPDENGKSYEKDVLLCRSVKEKGVEDFLRNEIGLEDRDALVAQIKNEYSAWKDNF